MEVLLALAAGLAVGSFLNLCAYRVARGESIIRPRSHCVSCAATLRVRELIPVLSYLLQRGRCRHCGAAISKRTLAGELCTGAAFVSLRAALGTTAAVPLLCGAASAVIFAAMLVVERRDVAKEATADGV
jgi:prepilin signal peptidase PulO-like enzyme (type II secretory pathway)